MISLIEKNKRVYVSEHASIISLGLFFFSISWLYAGYSFGHANHGQEIPPILAMLDTTLYVKDFAVLDFLMPGTRYVYYSLIAWFSGTFDIGVDTTLLIFKVISQLSFYIALSFIYRESINRINMGDFKFSFGNTALFGFFVSAVTFPLLSWGTPIFSPVMVPSTLAMAIAIWSLYFALRQQWVSAFIISSLAIPFHFLIGFFSGIVLTPALFLAVYKTRSIKWLIFPIVILLLSSLAIYLSAIISDKRTPDTFNFFEVFGMFRVPHHWLPSSAPWFKWVSDVSMLVAVLFASTILWREVERSRDIIILLAGVVITAVIGVIANYLFVELLQIEFFGKLQFQRIIPFGQLAIFLLVTINCFYVFLSGEKKQGFYVKFFTLLAMVLVMQSFIANIFLNLSLSNLIFSALFIFGILLFSKLRSRSRVQFNVVLVCLLLLVNSSVLHLLSSPISELSDRYQPFDTENWGGKEISKWLRENSPKESLILIPPFWSEVSDLLALHSNRSVYFSFKNVPYSNYGVWQWSMRLEELVGINIGPNLNRRQLRNLWNERQNDEVISIGENNGVCYLVDRFDRRSSIDLQLILTTKIKKSKWGLWKFENC